MRRNKLKKAPTSRKSTRSRAAEPYVDTGGIPIQKLMSDLDLGSLLASTAGLEGAEPQAPGVDPTAHIETLVRALQDEMRSRDVQLLEKVGDLQGSVAALRAGSPQAAPAPREVSSEARGHFANTVSRKLAAMLQEVRNQVLPWAATNRELANELLARVIYEPSAAELTALDLFQEMARAIRDYLLRPSAPHAPPEAGHTIANAGRFEPTPAPAGTIAPAAERRPPPGADFLECVRHYLDLGSGRADGPTGAEILREVQGQETENGKNAARFYLMYLTGRTLDEINQLQKTQFTKEEFDSRVGGLLDRLREVVSAT